MGASELLREALWAKLRQGARNVAGVRWQLAVSVHLLLLSRVGDLPFARVVPEGLEDLDCYAGDGAETFVQVKEVGAGAGRLTASEVASALEHARLAGTGRIVIVTDGTLGSGLAFTGWDETLGDVGGPGAAAVLARLEALGVTSAASQGLVARAHLISLPWNIRERTEKLMVERLDVHPSVASFVIGELYERMTSAAADQRHQAAQTALSVTLGDYETTLSAVQSSVDVAGLDEAVACGVCRPADFGTTSTSTADQFYLGVDGTPAHVAAAFDVTRASEMHQIVQAAQGEQYALVVGPSGSGKSVLLWHAARDVVLGARVIRVDRVGSPEDVQLLVRYARTLRPTAVSPVIVAVDDLGRRHTSAWPEAVAQLSEVPHVLLLGACREEDFTPALLRARVRIVRPQLDLDTAERIAQRVAAAGVPLRMSATEAWHRSAGHLMEFLSLVREGQHLEKVLAGQAADLATPSRRLQREAARLVLTAHSVGLSLTASSLARALAGTDATPVEIGDALAVLADEHVVVNDGATWTGLHELRSQTMAALMHATPPPTLADTLGAISAVLPAGDVGWLLRRAAERYPDSVLPIAEAVSTRVRDVPMPARELAELFEGAERADTVLYAAECVPLLLEGLPELLPAARFASWIFGMRHQGMASMFDEIASMRPTMRALSAVASRLPERDACVVRAVSERLTVAQLLQTLAASSMFDAARLLDVIGDFVKFSVAEVHEVFAAYPIPHEPQTADAWSRLIASLSRHVPAEQWEQTFGSVMHRALVIAQCEPSAVDLQFDVAVPVLTVLSTTAEDEPPGDV